MMSWTAPELGAGAYQEIAISPDGTRYAGVILTGDVEANGIWGRVIAGDTSSLADAANVKDVGRLFTRALGRDMPNVPTYGVGRQDLKWIDNQHFVFLWDDDAGIDQVVIADADGLRITYLTDSLRNVLTFSVSSAKAFSYVAPVPQDDRRSDQPGMTIDATGLYTLLSRGRDYKRGYEVKVGFAENLYSVRFPSGSTSLAVPSVLELSPSAEFLAVSGPPKEISSVWAEYEDRYMPRFVEEAHLPGGGGSWQIQQLYIVDVHTGEIRDVMNAPVPLLGTSVHWSPDGHSFLVGPTFLPPRASGSSAGLSGHAYVVVDAEAGDWHEIEFVTGNSSEMQFYRWVDEQRIDFVNKGGEILSVQRHDTRWVSDRGTIKRSKEDVSNVRIVIRESMNTPPELVARDRLTGEENVVLDLNPTLSSDNLGRAETFNWKDDQGRDWSGRLYYPVGYDPTESYPLVIQTHGMAPHDQFSLYGWGYPGGSPGTGPGVSIFAAQALAAKEIVVLQVEDKRCPGGCDFFGTPDEPRIYSRAYESAIQELSSRGIIDTTRVGLSGWSRTGWHVLYALTHSDFPYAAAIVSDNTDGSYMSGVAGGLTFAGIQTSYARMNGAPGYGSGLANWLNNAPGFSANRIRTPLRMQLESGGMPYIIAHWEIFNVLRVLELPVELAVVPDVDAGSHTLQNPRQLLSVQGGAVDWFDFWLNEHEDTNPKKDSQYVRWRELRDAYQAAMSKPRPPLLNWSATVR